VSLRFVANALCVGCRVRRVKGIGAVELLVELVAGRGRLTSVAGGLLCQTLGLSRLDVGFSLGGSGFGRGFVSERFALRDVAIFDSRVITHGFGLVVMVLAALVSDDPREQCEEYQRSEHEADDQKGLAIDSHVGSYLGGHNDATVAGRRNWLLCSDRRGVRQVWIPDG
jgi:hypothetical protein